VTLFPWIVLILVLVLLAGLVVDTPGALRGLVSERRLRFARPAVRAVVAVTLVELVIVLLWGLFLRPR
jgi:hypothetical protein